MNCLSCDSSNISKFTAWVEDIDKEEFTNDYSETRWNFVICNDCKIQTWKRPDKEDLKLLF